MLILADPTTPDALGGLLSLPSMPGSSLLQDVPLGNYMLYVSLGVRDVAEAAAAPLYGLLWWIVAGCVRAAIAMVWWMLSMTQQDGLGAEVGAMIGTGSAQLLGWLLPSALAIGGLLGWSRAKTGQDGGGSLVSTLVAGMLAVGMAVSGAQVIGGLDQGRMALTSAVSTFSTPAESVSSMPFEYPSSISGDSVAQLSVRTGDTLWRTYAVTPWCLLQFGSIEACKQYAPEYIKLQGPGEIGKFIDGTVKDREGGDEAATVRYMQGHDPAQRLAVAAMAMVTAIGVLLSVGGLALTGLMAWVTALLLLSLAVLWLCLVAIPGWARSAGVSILSAALGLTILSAVVTGLLAVMLVLSAAVIRLSAAAGQPWFPMAISGLAVLAAAWKARTIIESAMTGQAGIGSNMATRMAGFAALAGAVKVGRMGGRMAGRGGAAAGGAAGRGAARAAGGAGRAALNSGPGQRAQNTVGQARTAAASRVRGAYTARRGGSVPTTDTHQRPSSSRAQRQPQTSSRTSARGQGPQQGQSRRPAGQRTYPQRPPYRRRDHPNGGADHRNTG